MNRDDWLLLFLSREPFDVDAPHAELDPIRIQKGMFLLSKRGPARNLYEFRPYNWGPYSSAINSDLHKLESLGYVASERVPGQSWSRYRTTQKGEQRAVALADAIDTDDRSWLKRARAFVTTHSFTALLRKIYAAYPEYATKSYLH